MNRLAFNVLMIILTGVLPVSASDHLKKDYKKTIKKEFTIDNDGDVFIENRYGRVDIIPTSGNEVVIEVTIKVDKSSESKAEEFFDKVDIEFSNSGSSVQAKTEINGNNNSSWTSWLNPKNWNSNNNNYSIDYEVWMPSTCKLDLSNKYGNITVGDLDNSVSITLKYGDGVMQNIKGKLDLDLGYGDLKIGHGEDMELDIKYGEFRCKSGKEINCDSKYSDIYIDKAERLISDSGYDDFFIGEIDFIINDGGYDDFEIAYVEEFEFDSKYSDYIIGELSAGGTFDGKYGDITVKHVSGLSKGFHVEGSYSDVWLGMDLPFNIDLDSKYTDVDIPERSSLHTTYSRVKDGNETKIVAKGPQIRNDISAELKYGSIKIRKART